MTLDPLRQCSDVIGCGAAGGRSQNNTDLCVYTTVAECPGFTLFTHGTHDGSVGLADLFADDTTKQWSKLH